MYNLLMVGAQGYWDEDRDFTEFEWPRFLEHTDQTIRESFLPLSDESIAKLTSYPALFAYEFRERGGGAEGGSTARVGKIVEIRRRQKEVQFRYQFDPAFAPIPMDAIVDAAWDLDIDVRGNENFRSHWAVKDVDLVDLLRRKGLFVEVLPVEPAIADQLRALADPTPSLGTAKPKAFIVHGRDDGIKNEVARWLSKIGFDELVLHEQANLGRAIISKFQDVARDAAFAVVIATPDDVGGLAGGEQSMRARQNVILELGFFLGTLGPQRVALLKCDSTIELPSDYDGVLYIEYDRPGAWKLALAREFKSLNIPFDALAAF